MKNYNEMITTIANGDMGKFERGELIIREMCKMTECILNYKYAAVHYKGSGTIVEDKLSEVKNAMAVLVSDMDVYAVQMGIKDKVDEKAAKRIEKISQKLTK